MALLVSMGLAPLRSTARMSCSFDSEATGMPGTAGCKTCFTNWQEPLELGAIRADSRTACREQIVTGERTGSLTWPFALETGLPVLHDLTTAMGSGR